ncbi:UNVERIFIED_CONTAM: hypothetical protein FKN15_013043 [Acipenser sinensis]
MDRNTLAELLQALESRRDAEERRREERYTALIERTVKAPPELSKLVKHLRECFSMLELDFAEFRELTLAKLTEASIIQQLRDELAQVKNKSKASISELKAEVRGLQQENKSLRSKLAR